VFVGKGLNQMVLNLDQFETGTYLVSVVTDNGLVTEKLKIIM